MKAREMNRKSRAVAVDAKNNHNNYYAHTAGDISNHYNQKPYPEA